MEEDTAWGYKQNDHDPTNRNNDPNQLKYVLRHHIAPKVKELVRKGLSLDEIAAELGEQGIPVRDLTILGLAEQGHSLQFIGNHVDLERETIRKIVDCYGYKQRREEVKKKGIQEERDSLMRTRQDLVTVLRLHEGSRWNELVAQYGVAAYKAFEHFSQRVWTMQDDPKRVITLFSRYYQAKEKGEKKSLEELGKELGFFPTVVRQILKGVGLDPLYGKRQFVSRKESARRGEIIRRALDHNFSSSDIAYYTQYHPKVLNSWCIANGLNYPREQTGIYVPSIQRDRLILLHHIGEVYEAQDAGFSNPEILEFINPRGGKKPSRKGIMYILENRKSIEERIVNVLQKVYEDPTVSCAYQKWRYEG